jgi:hypothetical protein
LLTGFCGSTLPGAFVIFLAFSQDLDQPEFSASRMGAQAIRRLTRRVQK